MINGAQTRYDAAADVLYLISVEGEVVRSEEVAPGMTIEYGERGEVIGLEILRASEVISEKVVASLEAKQAGA